MPENHKECDDCGHNYNLSEYTACPNCEHGIEYQDENNFDIRN